MPRKSTSSTGFKGVYKNSSKPGLFRAESRMSGFSSSLGSNFTSPEAAHEALVAYETKMAPEIARRVLQRQKDEEAEAERINSLQFSGQKDKVDEEGYSTRTSTQNKALLTLISKQADITPEIRQQQMQAMRMVKINNEKMKENEDEMWKLRSEVREMKEELEEKSYEVETLRTRVVELERGEQGGSNLGGKRRRLNEGEGEDESEDEQNDGMQEQEQEQEQVQNENDAQLFKINDEEAAFLNSIQSSE